MPSIIAFVSQTGNVMKTTLAAAVGLQLIGAGVATTAIDLDPEHRALGGSLDTWARDRASLHPHRDQLPVLTADDADEALTTARSCTASIVIIDCPSRATTATAKIADAADFVVLPLVPGKKDSMLTLTTIARLIAAGVSLRRFAVVLTRTGSKAEAADTMAWIRSARLSRDYDVLVIDETIPERVGYRTAIAKGLAITEASHRDLRSPAIAGVEGLIAAYMAAMDDYYATQPAAGAA